MKRRPDIACHLEPLPALRGCFGYTEGLRRAAVRLAGRVGVGAAAYVYGCKRETLRGWIEIADFEANHQNAEVA